MTMWRSRAKTITEQRPMIAQNHPGGVVAGAPVTPPPGWAPLPQW